MVVRVGGSRRGYLGDVEGSRPETNDRVIPDVMNDFLLPQGRYPANIMLISQLEVCQEEGVKKGGTLRTLMVPDWRHG